MHPGQRSTLQMAFLQAVAENRSEALEEARLAVEQIVLRRRQPIELLPRSPDVILLQVRAVMSFRILTSFGEPRYACACASIPRPLLRAAALHASVQL